MLPRASFCFILTALTLGVSSRGVTQSIAVIANPSFRPTAVLQPHVRFVVGSDSLEGVAVIKDLGVPPVTFTGSIRVEGVTPGARTPAPHAFADTVRFEPDGRVVLLVADERGRPPMTLEVTGARGATGGRLAITAPRWPVGRILMVTISPADLYEMSFREAGHGVRDRIRVDNQASLAYLSDTTAGPTTVAIGISGGARGRFQSDVADVLLSRDFGGQTGTERRTMGALSLLIEPARDAGDTARAVVIFGVGNSEAEAARAAGVAGLEVPVVPRTAALRWQTPSAEVNLLLRHLLSAAGWMLDWDVVNGQRSIPGSAARPVINAQDAWNARSLVLQRGDSAALCGTQRLLRPSDAVSRREVALRLGRRGRFLASVDSSGSADTQALQSLSQWCRGVDADSPAPLTGTPASNWLTATRDAQRGINREYGRLSPEGGPGGLSLAEGGRFVRLIVQDLFGVSELSDQLVIAPGLEGIADTHLWQLDGWQLRGDSLGISYRPADRSAVIRLGAGRRQRLVLRFPWLTATSCVAARRGPDRERLNMVAQSDGSFYVDVRAFYDPAVLSIAAGPCS